MPSLGDLVAYCSLTALQGVLVALPRPVGPAALDRLRSSGWTVVLPGALLVGTFGVLAVPDGAPALGVHDGPFEPAEGSPARPDAPVPAHPLDGVTIVEFGYFYAMPYGERYIWGATAGMLKNLQFVLAGG